MCCLSEEEIFMWENGSAKEKETNLETNVFAEILVDVWSKRYCAATPSTRKQ